jgi:FKBP-type peptidyl-prolyl cis-trans isomerase FkpA
MKTKTLAATAALCAAVMAVSACKPIEGDGDRNRPATAFADLKDEKQKVSYIIGTQMGEQLAPVKDEVDMAVLVRALRDAVDGKASDIDEAQAMQVMQAFAERMQAAQLAQMQEQQKKNAAEGEAFLAENAKKEGVQTTASGLQYEVLEAGNGPRPSANDTVRVHYKGTLLDGETFDSSYDRGEPVQFALAQVVPGWQEGLQLMPVGSKYRLWVPAALGYGEMGTPGGPIGPNATLVFEVELLEIVDAAQ